MYYHTVQSLTLATKHRQRVTAIVWCFLSICPPEIGRCGSESGAEHMDQCTSRLGLYSYIAMLERYHSWLGYWTSYCERKECRSIPGEKKLRRMSKTFLALIDSILHSKLLIILRPMEAA